MIISKRVLIMSGVVAVILACFIGFAFAFSQMNQAPAQHTSLANIPTTVGSVSNVTSGQRACIIGIIQSLSKQSFVVSANQGKRVVTVTVNNQTSYSQYGNRTSSSFATLAVGNSVRVTAQVQCIRREATVLAQSVAILALAGDLTPISTAAPTP